MHQFEHFVCAAEIVGTKGVNVSEIINVPDLVSTVGLHHQPRLCGSDQHTLIGPLRALHLPQQIVRPRS